MPSVEENPRLLELPAKGAVRALDRSGALDLACARGALWITVAGDARDHVLRAGEALRLEGRGRVVVEALEPCAFVCEELRSRGRGLGVASAARAALRAIARAWRREGRAEGGKAGGAKYS